MKRDNEYDTARPFIASFVIFRKDGKVAFVLRKNIPWMNGYYGLPSGKVEKNETFVQAAVEEAQEEVGVTVRPDKLRPLLTVHRKAEDETDSWVDVYFEALEWEGEIYNAEPKRHGEVAWLDVHNLPENIVPQVRSAVEQIEAGNTYFEDNWPT